MIDVFTRECLTVEIDTSLSGERVARVLRRLSEARGLPEAIVQDNGSEFTSKVMLGWSRDAELQFIAPGKPMQNVHFESVDPSTLVTQLTVRTSAYTFRRMGCE